MTIEEMITDFTEQQSKVKAEQSKLKQSKRIVQESKEQ